MKWDETSNRVWRQLNKFRQFLCDNCALFVLHSAFNWCNGFCFCSLFLFTSCRGVKVDCFSLTHFFRLDFPMKYHFEQKAWNFLYVIRKYNAFKTTARRRRKKSEREPEEEREQSENNVVHWNKSELNVHLFVFSLFGVRANASRTKLKVAFGPLFTWPLIVSFLSCHKNKEPEKKNALFVCSILFLLLKSNVTLIIIYLLPRIEWPFGMLCFFSLDCTSFWTNR